MCSISLDKRNLLTVLKIEPQFFSLSHCMDCAIPAVCSFFLVPCYWRMKINSTDLNYCGYVLQCCVLVIFPEP